MESLLSKSFKLFISLLIIAGCSPERNNPFDPMGEELVWVSVFRPEAITVLPGGNLCISNLGKFTIFSPEGDSIDCFYRHSPMEINDLDVGFGRILSAYREALRLFALDGTFQNLVDQYEYESQLYNFSHLTGIYADDSYIYLVDSNAVIKMDSSFECLARWESNDDKTLYDIFQNEGYLYATLKNSIGIQVFDTSGNFVKEENLTDYWRDESFSRGITGDNTGNLFFFAYCRYFSSLDSAYHIDHSRICVIKEIGYEGTLREFLEGDDLLDIVYDDGYLYFTKYWDNNVRKLWLDGYIP
jgi:hypothetical protein